MTEQTTEQTTPNRSSKIPWVLGGLLFLFALPIIYSIVVTQATKEGVEFSPDDFTTRHFRYQKIEWLNWTISGLQHFDMTSSFQQSLINDLWITPATKPKKTWHLIEDSITVGDSPDFDARILYDYLEMPMWSEWNSEKKNQNKAKALWPAVAELARNYVYWAIPDLMDLAINQKSLSDQEFIDQVNRISAQSLLQDSKRKLAEGELEKAKQSIESAVNFDKTDEMLTTQAEIESKLGKE